MAPLIVRSEVTYMFKISSKRPTHGFTIVELLIVIVIIAILASVTVAAYTGVSNKAKSTQLYTAFDTHEKTLIMYYDLNRQYPVPSTTDPVCLGSGYSATNGFVANSCNQDVAGTAVTASTNAAVDTALATLIRTKPSIGAEPSAKNATTIVRGVLYHYTTPATGVTGFRLFFYLNGDVSCGGADKFTGDFGGSIVTQCAIYYLNGSRQTVTTWI